MAFFLDYVCFLSVSAVIHGENKIITKKNKKRKYPTIAIAKQQAKDSPQRKKFPGDTIFIPTICLYYVSPSIISKAKFFEYQEEMES